MPETKSKELKKNVALPEWLHRRVKTYASNTGVKIIDVVESALKLYMPAPSKERRK